MIKVWLFKLFVNSFLSSIISCPSIYSFIETAVEQKILIKQEGKDDKRHKMIKPSEIMIKEYK